MIKSFILSIVFLITATIIPGEESSAQEWKLVKEENGIKLYNRHIEGFEFKEVKAILHLNADLKKASTFLMNPKNIEKWMSGCSMSVEKKSGSNVKDYYAIFDAPWPISDRDDYGRIELRHLSDKRLHIDFRSIPDGTPKVSSMVRVPYSRGKLIIDIDANGKKVLTYQFLVDRGGSLPDYLREYLENTSPVNTVEKLKYTLEKL
ncbi:SRPBCC family protein [Portibacter marinus]|uniref:hypothetical protein n=1 Tax=Portibacter marinus TaxID=2898660 RepID=UPI001F20E31B|nr:hypothetical protein [Portibacter marinus]